MFEFYRIACAVPNCRTADFEGNVDKIRKLYIEAAENNASIVLFPAEAISGADCGSLKKYPLFERQEEEAIEALADLTEEYKTILVISNSCGEPIVLCGGNIWYADNTYTLFTNGKFSFAVCAQREAFEQIDNPGRADILLFPVSVTDTFETVRNRRIDLQALSKTFGCFCASCGAAASNTTARGVFSGHALVALDGRIISENQPFSMSEDILYCDIDGDIPHFLSNESACLSCDCEEFEVEEVEIPAVDELKYCRVNKYPFLPENDEKEYCSTIVDMASTALAVRLSSCGMKKMVLGISGGLDSTMALVVCYECCRKLGLPSENIVAVSMPGFGTEARTRDNSVALAEALKVDLRIIPITEAVNQHFKDIGHDPSKTDVVYENSQARERTQILMDIANQTGGLVVGTGDLSENALGWCTYNGDHMSMYAVNASIPKTLMRHIISNYASVSPQKLAEILLDVCDTPVSPELVPGKQYTEEIIGSYDLHDFFLYNFIKYGTSPAKLLCMAVKAFEKEYTKEKIFEVMNIFFNRFFQSQFKRAAMPDAPDLTGIELSKFEMPSDASARAWKKELEYLKSSDYLK